MKQKKWTYHRSHSFIRNGNNIVIVTQLYKASGVYLAMSIGNAIQQFTSTPKDMVKLEKGLIKDEKEGKITDLTFGVEITVIEDKDGFYKEVEE